MTVGDGAVIFVMDNNFARHLVEEISLLGLPVASAGYGDGEDSGRTINDYMEGRLAILILSYQHCFGKKKM